MKLRPYQQSAVQSVYQHLRDRDDNPVVVLPTGAGKSLVIASIVSDSVNQWKGRVLVLAHVKELLEQNTEKIQRLCPDLNVGIYSAGLKRRDTDTPVLVAGVQSIYKRACDLEPFDLIIVDECHVISREGDGMFRQFLADCKVINPHVRVIGLTATPFRLDSGLICSPDHFLNHVCFEVGIKELIRDGYLSPLVSKAGIHRADFANLHTRAGEFVREEVESLMNEPDLVKAACAEIVEYTRDRNKVLIFAAGVAHGQRVVDVLQQQHQIECGFVCGETPSADRNEILNRFRNKHSDSLFAPERLKYLCNVNVLTTGFDAPDIDCVVLLRPTLSPGLLVQMVGRGFRLHPGKQNCLILDFGGNIQRHGPVDQIKVVQRDDGSGTAPAKECPECHALIAAGYTSCPECGYLFPPPEKQQHDPKASEAGILSGQVTITKHAVREVLYSVHVKRGADENAPRTLRVEYRIGWKHYKSEWVCLEHDGYARQKAVAWWKQRSPDPIPDSIERAVEIAEGGGLADTTSITVRAVAGEEYERIINYELGPLPEPVVEFDDYNPDEVPF
ncbi:MAG: DEAD/DEAH box helicase family protein [Pirellulaceae bacterium]|nr:DEAD/DEAH box helicase family protein [Pirellulaceae bacterium]